MNRYIKKTGKCVPDLFYAMWYCGDLQCMFPYSLRVITCDYVKLTMTEGFEPFPCELLFLTTKKKKKAKITVILFSLLFFTFISASWMPLRMSGTRQIILKENITQ